jgi:hypothetical protein
MTDDASVAFVPYDNMKNVTKGSPLYGCHFTMIFCKKDTWTPHKPTSFPETGTPVNQGP